MRKSIEFYQIFSLAPFKVNVYIFFSFKQSIWWIILVGCPVVNQINHFDILLSNCCICLLIYFFEHLHLCVWSWPTFFSMHCLCRLSWEISYLLLCCRIVPIFPRNHSFYLDFQICWHKVVQIFLKFKSLLCNYHTLTVLAFNIT